MENNIIHYLLVIIASLICYVWGQLNARIKNLEKEVKTMHEKCPGVEECSKLFISISNAATKEELSALFEDKIRLCFAEFELRLTKEGKI